jgi:hypothetical protein
MSDDAAILSYNGKDPEYDVLFMGWYNSPGREFLDELLIQLNVHPVDIDCDIDALMDELPSTGVYHVVALGKIINESHYCDYYGAIDYDIFIEWTIISANKAPCFGALKTWYKAWKNRTKHHE